MFSDIAYKEGYEDGLYGKSHHIRGMNAESYFYGYEDGKGDRHSEYIDVGLPAPGDPINLNNNIGWGEFVKVAPLGTRITRAEFGDWYVDPLEVYLKNRKSCLHARLVSRTGMYWDTHDRLDNDPHP